MAGTDDAPFAGFLTSLIMPIRLGSTSAVIAALCTYLLLIFGAQAMMKNRAPLHARCLMQAYNITMSGVSLLLLVLMLEELRPLLRRVGIVDAICAEGSWTEVTFQFAVSTVPRLTVSSEIGPVL